MLDHRRVLEYAAEHPNAGRVRVGNALELPPSRIRSWLDGSAPDPVHAVNTASDYGWLDPDPSGETAAALVELLAHVLAGGSISEKWFYPAITPGRRVEAAELRQAFERIGVETTTRNADVDGRATEVISSDGASVLGRCLVTMGAPRGEKTKLDRLPPAVWEVPPNVRESFARIYCRHRAVEQSGKATLHLHPKRPQTYFKDLHALLQELTNRQITLGDGSLTISADAARELELA